MVLRHLDMHMQKMKLDSYYVVYTKINLKWIRDINVRPKIKKKKQKRIVVNLCDLALDNSFLDKTPNTQGTEEKQNWKTLT